MQYLNLSFILHLYQNIKQQPFKQPNIIDSIKDTMVQSIDNHIDSKHIVQVRY